MRGQDALMELRLSGRKPAAAFLHVLDRQPAYRRMTDPEELCAGELPTVDILPTDNPAVLDLRCMAGLQVHLLGTNEARVGAVMRRLLQFDELPALVIASGWRDNLIVRWTPAGYEKLETP